MADARRSTRRGGPPTKTPLIDLNPAAAITRLTTRSADVEKLSPDVPDDPRFENVERDIQSDICEIFGADSNEDTQHWSHRVFYSDEPEYLALEPDDPSVARRQQRGRKEGIKRTLILLESLRRRVEERAQEQAINRGDAKPAHAAIKALELGQTPRILQLLGSGAEADVYLVVDRFGREVAAKIFYESKRVPTHIFAHAAGLARVPHPAVATLYSIDEVVLDGCPVPAILMERLVGEELEQRLRREIALEELISWGRTLLDVFAAMHGVEHFHPDPHMGNFIVTDHGLRLYDVLHSLSAENRSTGTKDALRSSNARRVRDIIEAMFEKLRWTELVQTASKSFSGRTRHQGLTLAELRNAFSDSVQALVDAAGLAGTGVFGQQVRPIATSEEILYREAGSNRRAQIVRIVDDNTVDVAVYDEHGNLVHGVTEAKRAISDAERSIDGKWWRR